MDSNKSQSGMAKAAWNYGAAILMGAVVGLIATLVMKYLGSHLRF